MSHEVFVSSRIATVRHRALNLRIAARCERLGLRPFLPQRELWDVEEPIEILARNEAAVSRAAVVVVVFDGAAAGVAMELGRAFVLDKPIIGFRGGASRRREHLGMMLEGAWARLPSGARARTVAELEHVLARWATDC